MKKFLCLTECVAVDGPFVWHSLSEEGYLNTTLSALIQFAYFSLDLSLWRVRGHFVGLIQASVLGKLLHYSRIDFQAVSMAVLYSCLLTLLKKKLKKKLGKKKYCNNKMESWMGQSYVFPVFSFSVTKKLPQFCW